MIVIFLCPKETYPISIAIQFIYSLVYPIYFCDRRCPTCWMRRFRKYIVSVGEGRDLLWEWCVPDWLSQKWQNLLCQEIQQRFGQLSELTQAIMITTLWSPSWMQHWYTSHLWLSLPDIIFIPYLPDEMESHDHIMVSIMNANLAERTDACFTFT